MMPMTARELMAVLTDEPIPRHFDCVVRETERNVWWQHEAVIGGRMQHLRFVHARRIEEVGYNSMLLDHYLHGKIHPDDVNLPLNKWDETP